MQNYHYSGAMSESSNCMQSFIKNETPLPQHYFSPFNAGYSTRGPQITSTPQRFLLPTTSESYVSTETSTRDYNVHTVPQTIDYSSHNRINDSDSKMFMEENSSTRSYSPDSSSDGELCIDESVMSSNEEDSHQSSDLTRSKSQIMSMSSAIQLNLLDRYKLPNQIPVVYHKNMARQFPEAQGKTEQQKLQRKKNTEAARQSRAKAKILETLVESECRQAATENVNAKRMIATQRAYANSLLQLLHSEKIDWSAKWQEHLEKSRCEM